MLRMLIGTASMSDKNPQPTYSRRNKNKYTSVIPVTPSHQKPCQYMSGGINLQDASKNPNKDISKDWNCCISQCQLDLFIGSITVTIALEKNNLGGKFLR